MLGLIKFNLAWVYLIKPGINLHYIPTFYTSLKSRKYGLSIHHCYGGTNKKEEKYETARAKMSTVVNERVHIH